MTMSSSPQATDATSLAQQIQQIDDQLSKRSLALDPTGYFIIYVDRDRQVICAKFFRSFVNEQGLATDPDTGQVLPAKGKIDRAPEQVYTGRTAKELCVTLFEELGSEPLITQLSHAAYLGRELQRAEYALIQGSDYIQD